MLGEKQPFYGVGKNKFAVRSFLGPRPLVSVLTFVIVVAKCHLFFCSKGVARGGF